MLAMYTSAPLAVTASTHHQARGSPSQPYIVIALWPVQSLLLGNRAYGYKQLD